MGRLSGMKAICDYEDRHEDTMLKMIRDEDYPAVKIRGGWESDTELIDDWRRDRINNRKVTIKGKKFKDFVKKVEEGLPENENKESQGSASTPGIISKTGAVVKGAILGQTEVDQTK